MRFALRRAGEGFFVFRKELELLGLEKRTCYIGRIAIAKGASMTITRKPLFLSLFLIVVFLFPSFMWAGGKKESSEPAPEATESVETTPKERTPIEVASPSDNAAIVNGVAIPLDRYQQQLSVIQQQYLMQGISVPEEQMAELKGQVLESLIDQELLAQEAKGQGYEADQTKVDQQLQQIKGQFPSEEQYYQALAQQGISEQDFLAELKKSLVVQQFVSDRFASQVAVTEEDSKTYYDDNPSYFVQPERVRASHILFSVAEDASDQDVAAAKTKAESALERYKNGEEFSDLARELSEGPSASQGGDLGFFGRNQMVKPFEDAAFSMKVGEVSDPVRTKFGFHLIRLTARNEKGTLPFDQVKPQISDHLYKLRLGELVKAFLDEQKEKSEINRLLDLPQN